LESRNRIFKKKIPARFQQRAIEEGWALDQIRALDLKLLCAMRRTTFNDYKCPQ
jgi:hypothetical protein